LAHVIPLRNYFLVPENYQASSSSLLAKFGQLIRRIWSCHNFKSVISPHEFVQEISVASNRSFHIHSRAHAVDFLLWLLHSLHKALAEARLYVRCNIISNSVPQTKKPKFLPTTIIHAIFQGKLRIETMSRRTNLTSASIDTNKKDCEEAWEQTSVKEIPFLCLALDIPPMPLFKDSRGGNIIPQIPLFDLLTKYNGVKFFDSVKAGIQTRCRFTITKLPPYLIFHLKRFSKNNFTAEKNPTIVNFPVKNLQLNDHFAFESPFPSLIDTKFNLVSNVCHDLPAGLGKEAQQDPLQYGTYRVHLRHPASDQWYEIQDLHVAETIPQLISLSESLFSIYASSSSSSSTSGEPEKKTDRHVSFTPLPPTTVKRAA